MIKKLVAVGVSVIAASLLFTGCSGSATKQASEEWVEVMSQQPGVADAYKTASTPLPFTYQVSLHLDVAPEPETYTNIEKVSCETAPSLSAATQTYLTVLSPKDVDELERTNVTIERSEKCMKIYAAYAEFYTTLDTMFPSGNLTIKPEVNDLDNSYSLTTLNPTTLANIAEFLKTTSNLYTDTFIFDTTGYSTNNPEKTVTIKFDGEKTQTEDYAKVLEYINGSEEVVSKVAAENGTVTVTYSFGVSEEEVATHQQELEQLNLTTLTPVTELQKNSGTNSSGSVTPEKSELADVVATEYKDTNLTLNLNSTGLAVFVDDVAQATKVTNFIAENNPDNVPIRVNLTSGEKVRFDGYYVVNSETNDFSHMIEDYVMLKPQPALLWTWFKGTTAQISVDSEYDLNSPEYKELEATAQSIADNGNYSSFTIRKDETEKELR